ncbi:MAG: type II toxin-antitoxin system RelE/ParE family toxin [Alcaligenaceae bacterium]|nr:type II toxin-antitoxin system RelE/ParE family toxin [Alcaligenaceae bacterium]
MANKVQIRIQGAASYRIDEIYRYTRDHWETQQADRYITGLFKAFDGIATHQTLSRPIPAEFGIDGYFFRYEQHFVYWRRLANNDIGIVTILHVRMHQIDRFLDDFGEGA